MAPWTVAQAGAKAGSKSKAEQAKLTASRQKVGPMRCVIGGSRIRSLVSLRPDLVSDRPAWG
jgi:hypothetical protein